MVWFDVYFQHSENTLRAGGDLSPPGSDVFAPEDGPGDAVTAGSPKADDGPQVRADDEAGPGELEHAPGARVGQRLNVER